MIEATPRPWQEPFHNESPVGGEWVIPGVGMFFLKPDAELARSAANSFDALVAACEAIAAHIDPDAPAPTTTRREAMLQLRAALALAKGGGT